MAYRNLIIESPASISVKNEQLLIRTDGEHMVAIEDISALLLESRRSTITTAALSLLGQGGCAVFVCDDKHMPCAVTMPFSQHSRALAVAGKQLSMTQPMKKRLWQSVVEAKIENQSECLALNEKQEASEYLHSLSMRVRSGDSENVEAIAAAFYFPKLFGAGFTRGEENGVNSALNYGYAILRGCIARSLAVYGFLPCFGIHHCSELNSYNLADDLIEPFRPVIDLLVSSCFASDDELTPNNKRLLFNALNLDVLSGGQRHSVSYAIERLVQSLARSLDKGGAELLLPELLELKQHAYE